MFRFAVSILFSVSMLSAVGDTAWARLASHSAVYDLSLKETQDRAIIFDLVGRMAVSTDINCGGLVFEQRLIMEFTDDSGNSFVNDFQISTWEAMDGSRFRFTHADRIDNETAERISGKAALKERSGGKAVFKEPDEKTVHLAPGTMFPTAHLLAIIETAMAGERLHTTMIFDETSETPVLEAVTVIGEELDEDAVKGLKSGLLEDLRAWPVSVAFFDLESIEGLPEYQVNFRLYENGVAGDMVMDFGDFSVNARLVEISPGDEDACAGN